MKRVIIVFEKKPTYRIVIGGCRDFEDYSVFEPFVDKCLERLSKEGKITILSGHCSGVDTMAEQYAKKKKYGLEIYPAEWKKYGKRAGPLRNELMVKKSDFVIAFWDKKSRGTKSLIEFAKENEKPTRIKYIEKDCIGNGYMI